MSRRKSQKNFERVIEKFLTQIWKLTLTATQGFFDWLLRSVLVTQPRGRRTGKAGFILPTVTMLLLVVALVIGAILFRTGSRTNQVITERNQQVIYNAATPAIDRAKAKLEYLFKRDNRLPNTVPPEGQLMSALLNDGTNNISPIQGQNPYLLPDEQQIQLAGQQAPAWRYQSDVDGDGQLETIAYSILLKSQHPVELQNPSVTRDSNNNREKANNLVVRNGPITAQRAANPACERLNLAPDSGWDLASTASLRKTFQVTAVVISNKPGNRTVTTLEFQQDRELARANKWGAWARYDMHLFPFPPFRWNGAIHTEGTMFLGGQNSDSIQSYLISSPASCLYDPDSNSQITIGRVKNAAGQVEFAGQVAKGSIGGTPAQDANIHIQQEDQQIVTDASMISANSDSVSNGGSVGPNEAEQMSLDPVVLFTQGISRSISPDNNRNNTGFSTDEWRGEGEENERPLPNQRITPQTEKPPYIDDTYRADDRLGPKPFYDLEGENNDVTLSATLRNGTPIINASLSGNQREQLLRNDRVATTDEQYRTIGLDGYWERRARAQGTRIIVGQRLELGNPFGWGTRDANNDNTIDPVTETDPLYPVANSGITGSVTHLQQQRRTLRDNLAAVQATVVYHHGLNTGDFPASCIATTSHPGTGTAPGFPGAAAEGTGTIGNSTNFRSASQYYAPVPGQPQLVSDFFTGRGTNGWEFSIAPEGAFNGGPLRTALLNLANFAGDYANAGDSGAFPPTMTSPGRIYPDPYLTMWGNFSNLRRALDAPVTNPIDGKPSIADRSYIHTAGCALGMLAYNVNYFNQYNPASANTTETALRDLFDPDQTNGDVKVAPGTGLVTSITPRGGTPQAFTPGIPLTPDLLISLLPEANKPEARLVAMVQQIARDRRFGFAPSSRPATDLAPIPGQPTITIAKEALAECSPTNVGSIPNTSALTLLCPSQPKFPSLYYLFPDIFRPNRDISGNPNNINTTEPYIRSTSSIAPGQFQPVDIANIAAQFTPNTNNWVVLPTGGSPSVSNPTPLAREAFRVTTPGGGALYVPIIDKGIFDGREMMSVRVLDIDLERLKLGPNPPGGDTWFPTSGVFYAFREDAVREDAIERRWRGRYTDPRNPVRTDATNPIDPRDPDLEPNGISPKPVDFYGDPDRRPYGFRLRNGADIRRNPQNNAGITFVTDNVIAVQGNFNLHTQEEFSERLADDFGNFYTRNSLNTNFALNTGDNWRPAELLGDAVFMLSDNFDDGSIDRGFRNAVGQSYRGMGFGNPANNWIREDGSSAASPVSFPTPPGNAEIPIKIFRDGNPRFCGGASILPCQGTLSVFNPLVNFQDQSRRSELNTALDTRINAIVVSGVVPARANQSNGGFHNFPRLLENWTGIPLRIAGSFIQLNFSTSATGPFDQDAIEPTETPQGDERGFHFLPPSRLWGYDVGLQYAPAGPVSRRFITAESPRSEFYEELSADDPYVCNLRRALATSGQQGTEDMNIVNQECQP